MPVRAFVRPLAALLVLAALLGLPRVAAAGMGDVRTLVVRGQVLAADGTPVSGAHLSARGSGNMSALTDDRGRYSLSVTIGSAAGLRRGAFTLEVRADQAGRRLAFGAGASALGVEVALVPGGARVRVRSNSPQATSALISAFAQDGAATAWVDADFGGAARAGGAPVLSATDEVAVDGSSTNSPAPRVAAAAPRESATATPQKRLRADSLPHASAPAKPATQQQVPVPPAPTKAAPEKPVPVTPSAVTPAPVVPAPVTPAPVVATPVEPAHVVPAPVAPASVSHLAPSHLDSPVRVGATASRAPMGRSKKARAARARGSNAPRVAVTDVPAPHPAAPPGGAPALPPATLVLGTPMRTAEPSDTCTCRMRGTVEIDWERPLERDFPVELSLEGPAVQHGSVDMFIGSPREFRFGPLPCGEYRLVVRPRGRLHYTLERGDSSLAVSCHGLTQVRVVLVPARH